MSSVHKSKLALLGSAIPQEKFIGFALSPQTTIPLSLALQESGSRPPSESMPLFNLHYVIHSVT